MRKLILPLLAMTCLATPAMAQMTAADTTAAPAAATTTTTSTTMHSDVSSAHHMGAGRHMHHARHDGHMGAPGPEGFLRKFDMNHDGQVTKAEFGRGMNQMFMKLDTNHDGTVTKDELDADWQAHMQQHDRFMDDGHGMNDAHMNCFDKDGHCTMMHHETTPTSHFNTPLMTPGRDEMQPASRYYNNMNE